MFAKHKGLSRIFKNIKLYEERSECYREYAPTYLNMKETNCHETLRIYTLSAPKFCSTSIAYKLPL